MIWGFFPQLKVGVIFPAAGSRRAQGALRAGRNYPFRTKNDVELEILVDSFTVFLPYLLDQHLLKFFGFFNVGVMS